MPVKIRSRKAATHYENLKVSEKAPVEVIKAAYRALSLRWHPDKNSGDPRAARMMRMLNEAYEVLSDPMKRQEYDATLVPPRQAANAKSSTPQPAPAWKPRKKSAFSFAMVVRSVQRWNPRWALVGAAVVLAGLSAALLGPAVSHYLESRAQAMATASETTENAVSSEALPQRPTLDLRFTNPLTGQPWPKHASYLSGFEKLATDGYSSVTVDNSKNTSDVFLKLVSAENRQPSKVMRVCFVPARTTFTFYRVAPGRYELRYQEVEDGICRKTETFLLSQTKRYQGVECTQLRVPLYGLPGRSVNLLQSDEREFIAATPTAIH